jgi:ABC-type Fe3+ transport system permease subunit
MTASDLLSLVGLLGALLLVVIATAAVFAPFALYSIAGSLRGIRRELERINGASAPAPARIAAVVTTAESEPAAPTLAHRFTR